MSFRLSRRNSERRRAVRSLAFFSFLVGIVAAPQCSLAQDAIALGRSIFEDKSFSRDGQTSCSSCHDPAHSFADVRSVSKGVFGKTGTRNAPSLLGVANNKAFFWDGRRSHLDEAVLDAFINPVELDLDSIDDVLQRIRANNNYSAAFRRIFPQGANAPNAAQVASVISAFLATLTTGTSDFDRELRNEKLLSPLAEQGKTVFDTVARCSECHSIAGTKPRFTDDAYHFSAIGSSLRATSLASLTQEVISDNLAPSALGPRILTDAGWSSLGRFVVTQSPGDIGFFKTPSLRNVSRTAPYMHDGSIASLEEAMNYEIYYRANGGSGVLTLSLSEREALLAFLESLSDTTTNR